MSVYVYVWMYRLMSVYGCLCLSVCRLQFRLDQTGLQKTLFASFWCLGSAPPFLGSQNAFLIGFVICTYVLKKTSIQESNVGKCLHMHVYVCWCRDVCWCLVMSGYVCLRTYMRDYVCLCTSMSAYVCMCLIMLYVCMCVCACLFKHL